MICILCKNPLSHAVYDKDLHRFYRCQSCDAFIRDPTTFLDASEEKKRYECHNNDITDHRYRKFVSPITEAVMKHYPATNTLGLDFGAGTGPVIAEVLKEAGYRLNLYDPFFIPNTAVLEEKYDYVVCCEVIEHFHDPLKEFKLLRELLCKKGKLFCMTAIFTDNLSFSDWYYKNDPTHVIIYTEKTLHWIRQELGFEDVHIANRLITFTR